jgi:hypothetical protein
MDRERFRVPINGYVMQLGRSELESVAVGSGQFDAADKGSLTAVVEALRSMPSRDRAPLWELAVRHFGRHKPLQQAAGEIGMDAIHARELVAAFSHALARVPRPNTQ